MRRILPLILGLMLCFSARAETDGDCLYSLVDAEGNALTQRAGRMYEGDEYISGDDLWYRVTAVDDAAQTATAECLGPADEDAGALDAFFTIAFGEASDKAGEKRIGMYSTHSDESYVPDDGEASKWHDAGIYDVGDSLRKALEEKGIKVTYSRESFLPHDADAYTRSRRTAEELLKQRPDALLDIHRDAVPASQYETTVEGEDVSKVRLFVGRSNQNAAENKAFARQIKAEADRQYPGLVKDIFIGRGNYNQELYPHALLLEFGTHEIDKDKAMESARYMADVLDSVLYGSAAKAEGGKATEGKSVARGVGGLLGIALLAAVVYAFVSTGSGKGAMAKLRRNASELTGGLFGDKDRK